MTFMNNDTNCHSICLSLAWITCSSLPRNPSAALRRVSWGIFAIAFSRELLRASTDTWEEAQACASKRDQTQKSIGLRSGDEGGQTSLLQNPGKWSWHHFCVFLDVCDGAPFCWKMNGLSFEVLFSCLKCRSQDCFNVRICIHFCSLWNKNDGGLPRFWNGGPHHDRRRFLLPKNASRGVRNVCRGLC